MHNCSTTVDKFIDFTNEKHPKCSNACPSTGLKYIDNITNSNEIRCVSSCKELIPPAFIDTEDGKGSITCLKECKDG